MKILILSIVSTLVTLSAYAGGDRQFPNPGQVYKPGVDVNFGQYLAKSLRGTRKVVLTFDDGPDAIRTPKLLDILKAHDVKATFFILTGNITAETLPVVKRMIAEGHNVASHHHNHISSDVKTEEVYRSELKTSILKTAGLLEEENSIHREIYYRFPYGAYGSKKLAYHHLNVMKEVSHDLFGDNCINFAFWDIDTADWLETITAAEIAQGAMSNIFGGTAYDFEFKNGKYVKIKTNISKPVGGGVILMHDVYDRTVNAVSLMLKQFKEKGVEVVSLQDVKEFSFGGKECRLKI